MSDDQIAYMCEWCKPNDQVVAQYPAKCRIVSCSRHGAAWHWPHGFDFDAPDATPDTAPDFAKDRVATRAPVFHADRWDNDLIFLRDDADVARVNEWQQEFEAAMTDLDWFDHAISIYFELRPPMPPATWVAEWGTGKGRYEYISPGPGQGGRHSSMQDYRPLPPVDVDLIHFPYGGPDTRRQRMIGCAWWVLAFACVAGLLLLAALSRG